MFAFVPDDNVRAARMENGDFDATELPPKADARFRDRDDVTVYDVSSAGYRGVMLPLGGRVPAPPAARDLHRRPVPPRRPPSDRRGGAHPLGVDRPDRAQRVLSLRERPLIDAAISGGASRWRVTRRHLAPNIVPHVALATALMLPHAIWHESALSFLGLGLPPHLASLGNMIADGARSVLAGAWWPSFFPGLAIVVPTLAVSVLGGWLRDRINPRWRSELQL